MSLENRLSSDGTISAVGNPQGHKIDTMPV